MQMHLLAGETASISAVSSDRAIDNAALINQDSGNFEYYTPRFILDAARLVLGTIDLDPASSYQANRIVQAKQIFTCADDGLAQPWNGTVWMNHPFGRERNPQWIQKLVGEYVRGNISAACCITFSSTSERWFQPLFDFPICFLHPRTNYLLPDGSPKRGVTKGSAVAYLGDDLPAFVRSFSPLGRVMLPTTT